MASFRVTTAGLNLEASGVEINLNYIEFGTARYAPTGAETQLTAPYLPARYAALNTRSREGQLAHFSYLVSGPALEPTEVGIFHGGVFDGAGALVTPGVLYAVSSVLLSDGVLFTKRQDELLPFLATIQFQASTTLADIDVLLAPLWTVDTFGLTRKPTESEALDPSEEEPAMNPRRTHEAITNRLASFDAIDSKKLSALRLGYNGTVELISTGDPTGPQARQYTNQPPQFNVTSYLDTTLDTPYIDTLEAGDRLLLEQGTGYIVGQIYGIQVSGERRLVWHEIIGSMGLDPANQLPIGTGAQLGFSRHDITAFKTENQIISLIDSRLTSQGYRTVSQIRSIIEGYGYLTSSQIQALVGAFGYQTAAQVDTRFNNRVHTKTSAFVDADLAGGSIGDFYLEIDA